VPSLRSLTIALSIFRSECSQDGRCQIVGERAFLLRALHEHRDRRPDALIDENDESLFLVAKKNGEAVAGRSYGMDVHFDNGLTHTASLYSHSRQGLVFLKCSAF
jgi:hypothetical protein